MKNTSQQTRRGKGFSLREWPENRENYQQIWVEMQRSSSNQMGAGSSAGKSGVGTTDGDLEMQGSGEHI